MTNKKGTRVGLEQQYGPRNANSLQLHPCSYLCVSVKSWLKNERMMKPGKNYRGVMRRDVDADEFACDEHFTFTETSKHIAQKRNPRVFSGRYITITQKDNGELSPNFKHVDMDAPDFSTERYVQAVANELLWGLLGLRGE